MLSAVRVRLPGRHRLVRVAAACACAVVVALAVASYVLFVRAGSDGPGHADAVVVLAGGRGERLARAQTLMARDVAPTIAISNGNQPGWHDANRLCEGAQRFRVICFRPQPQTTRGEAEAIRRLARDNGWRRVVIVTSTYHLTRARMLVRRCYDGHTSFVGATPRDGIVGWAKRIVHEWFGLAEAVVVRGC